MRVRRALRLAGAAVLALALAYVGAALVGTLWRSPSEGPMPGMATVRIWVIANPIHTDIVLPVRGPDTIANADLRPLINGAAFSADAATLDLWRDTVRHVAVSWGARTFFLGVPTWDRLRPIHVATAVWDDSAFHLTLIDGPETIAGAVAVDLDEAQYARLLAALDASVRGGLAGAVPIRGAGYTTYDAFYEGVGAYTPLRTCNVWAGDVLAAAGVSVGRWTPLPQPLRWSLLRGLAAG